MGTRTRSVGNRLAAGSALVALLGLVLASPAIPQRAPGPHASHPLTPSGVEAALGMMNGVVDRRVVLRTWTASDADLKRLVAGADLNLAAGAATEAGLRMREATIPALTAALGRARDEKVALAAVRAIERWHSKTPLPEGLRTATRLALGHPAPRVRYEGATLLATLGDASVAPTLRDAVRRTCDPLTARAAHHLWRLTGSAHLADVPGAYARARKQWGPIRPKAPSAEQATARGLQMVLGRMGDARALQDLAKLVDAEGAYPGRDGPLFVLVEARGLAERPRLERLFARDINSRLAAVEAIGRLGDPKGAALILSARKRPVDLSGTGVWTQHLATYEEYVASELGKNRKVALSPHEWRWKSVRVARFGRSS